ncbi:hypothetical protein EJ03DRAFT_316077 [Teratosphaeria nubilosa]|uniref:N-acetylgalactosaminide beta-1,3-galactosyltransferase n=1 Tax=Teratosphaeria nubilosa TaxID=161662 RepID=A0A6G1L4X3_9PEZI|nr:hypothetical protein EJ03DRAFT_316077 [Teratosphaeria nubilosa]
MAAPRSRGFLLRYLFVLALVLVGAHWSLRGSSIATVHEKALEHASDIKWPSSLSPLKALGLSGTSPSRYNFSLLESTSPPCAQMEGAEDVVLAIKTGATEALERLPIHSKTTLQCFPNSLVFSDLGENLDGIHIQDALDEFSEDIRTQHEDFEHWRRLHEHGRAGLDASAVGVHVAADNLEDAFSNGGWKLDRFKNLPMISKTLNQKPDAKWYVFQDADTYISWSNLRNWTSRMDHEQMIYLGSPAVIDEQVFAHGGSGYVLSKAAMRAVEEQYRNNQTFWDEFAANHWAGDCVLSWILSELGTGLTWGYPLLQGKKPATLDFVNNRGYDRRMWCYPAVSFHHVEQDTIETLWRFEQVWTAEMPDQPMRFGDIFLHWSLPQALSGHRTDWDNYSGDIVNFDERWDEAQCRQRCQDDEECLQWALSDGVCKTSTWVALGESSARTASGWMDDRILNLEIEACTEGEWIMPDS